MQIARTWRKKPVVIEAVQWTGVNSAEILNFVGAQECSIEESFLDDDGAKLVIKTLEGDMTAAPLDWIIKGVKGEFYPCKPDIFLASYEPVAS